MSSSLATNRKLYTSIEAKIADLVNGAAPAVEILACHQEQCDMDGVMVKVSRQALDEALEAINQVAITLEAVPRSAP